MALLKLCILQFPLLFCLATPLKRSKDTNSTSKSLDDENLVLAINRLKHESEERRSVALFCRSKCLRLRNANLESLEEDRLPFHFHLLKKPIKVFGIETEPKKSHVFYLVAGQGFHFDGDESNEKSFKNWLLSFERVQVFRPLDHVELDGLLNKVESCADSNKVVLFLHDLNNCPDLTVQNVARSLSRLPAIQVTELHRPLTSEMEAVLSWRLPTLSNSCKTIVYLHKGVYYQLEQQIQPSLLVASFSEWTVNCNVTTPSEHKIRAGLTEVQLEYLSEERSVKKIQENQVYIVVGAIGGIAVIALAISIFWGLQSA